MQKYSEIEKGHTLKYDLSNSKKILEEAISKIRQVIDEYSKLENTDITDLEEGWNLIDKYYGNVVRGEIFKRKNNKYIPNTSATFPKKGDS
jgi:hypothetical protein